MKRRNRSQQYPALVCGEWPRFVFTQQKTGGEVDVPILEELARELALAPKDALAFILTEWGKTFTQKCFGNWFNDKCRAAGLVNRTVHGIRSGGATNRRKQRCDRTSTHGHVWLAVGIYGNSVHQSSEPKTPCR